MGLNTSLRRIGILTGGGDCPGLNAVIRSVAKPAMRYFGSTIVGVVDGFEGLVEGKMRELGHLDVSGIINVGGTILGTSNKGNPFLFPREVNGEIEISDCSQMAYDNYKKWKLDGLVVIGGDGTMNIAYRFHQMGMNVIGVPKTIDNDLEATDVTFGYDSAVSIATEAIDRLQTTASAHHRVMVVELMGRYAGWITLAAGIAGGADMILIPEIPFKWSSVFEKVLDRSHGARFSIIAVSEGAKPEDGGLTVREMDKKRTDPVRLGGVGDMVAKRIQEETGLETRVAVLGHVQRGGSPTAYDRILATKFGSMALDAMANKRWGSMVALRGMDVIPVPLEDAIRKQRLVPMDSQLLLSARAVGTSFGD